MDENVTPLNMNRFIRLTIPIRKRGFGKPKNTNPIGTKPVLVNVEHIVGVIGNRVVTTNGHVDVQETFEEIEEKITSVFNTNKK